MSKLLLLIFLIALGGGVYYYFPEQIQTFLNRDPRAELTTGKVVEMEGILVGYDNKCEVDGYCIAYVDDYEIIVNMGMANGGLPFGEWDVSSKEIGSNVKVKAKVVLGKKLSIIGSKDYFVLKK